MVLHAKFASEVFKQLVKLGSRYYRAEGQAFNKLYRGFPQSRNIGRGVRHGLTVGSTIGSFISQDADDSPGNGIQTTIQKTKQPTSRESYQTRSRRTRRFCPGSEYRYGNRKSR